MIHILFKLTIIRNTGIVVTDLTEFEEAEDQKEYENKGIVIPDSVLKHFSKKIFGDGLDIRSGPEQPRPSNALVLYRPLPGPDDNTTRSKSSTPSVEDEPIIDVQVNIPSADDAMDIEPL